MVYGNSILNASSVVFKKLTALECSNYYKEFKYCGDWIFWLEIASKGKVVKSAKFQNYFRKHQSDVTGQAKSSGLYIKEYKLIVDFLVNSGYISQEHYYLALINMLKNIEQDRNYSKSLKKQARQEYLQLIPTKYLVKKKIREIYNLILSK